MQGLIILVLLVLNGICAAQPAPQTQWTQVWGTTHVDITTRVYLATDGSIIGIGKDGNPPCMLTVSADGQTAQTHEYSAFSAGFLTEAIALPGPGYILLGSVWTSFNDADLLILRVDAAGQLQSSRVHLAPNSQRASGAVRLADESILIAGDVSDGTSTGQDVLLTKLNAAGDMLWQRQYGGAGADWVRSIQPTADGHFALVGATYSYGQGGSEAYMLKVNSDGDTLWTRSFGGAGHDGLNDLVCLADGSIVAAGYTRSYGDGGVLVVKVDANGSLLWQQHVGGEPGETAQDIIPAAQGGFAMAGEVYVSSQNSDGYLLRIDGEGNQIWRSRYHRNWGEWFESLVQTADSAFVLAGCTIETRGTNTSNDFWFVKTGGDPQLTAAEPAAPLPAAFTLTAFPNPFNAVTTLALDLPQAGRAQLEIIDVLGRTVQSSVFENLSAGRHTLPFHAGHLASGVYFAHLRAGAFSATQKLMLLK